MGLAGAPLLFEQQQLSLNTTTIDETNQMLFAECGSIGSGTLTPHPRGARIGLLPKVMPLSLEELDLSGGDPDDDETPHKFTGGIPAECGSLTNLKKLSMQSCGLDGEWMIQIIPNGAR